MCNMGPDCFGHPVKATGNTFLDRLVCHGGHGLVLTEISSAWIGSRDGSQAPQHSQHVAARLAQEAACDIKISYTIMLAA